VVADAQLVRVESATDALVGEGSLEVSLAVVDSEEALAVAHAANAGTVTLVRTTGAESGAAEKVCTPAPAEG
jgi:hypothetical protein